MQNYGNRVSKPDAILPFDRAQAAPESGGARRVATET
jgi:hypothetical protein